jgi:hypothetical protein
MQRYTTIAAIVVLCGAIMALGHMLGFSPFDGRGEMCGGAGWYDRTFVCGPSISR